jgi:small subunit ribosomal protein S3
MGQKVHPHGIRLGIVKDHSSVWYANKNLYAASLLEDLKIRAYINKKLSTSQVSKIHIARAAGNVEVVIYTARAGTVIGKKGADIEKLKVHLSNMLGSSVHINIESIKNAGADSALVAANIASQLERRMAFRRVLKSTLQSVMRCSGVEGVKIKVSGRLGGAEIARSEQSHVGRVPLHTFRADIDYSSVQAQTTYGIIGVKVWIFKGEIHKFNKSN